MTTPPSPTPRSATPSTLAAQAGPPPRVPDYELLRCIGTGSYGEVWLARSAVGGWVAVKVVRRARFEHDASYEREFIGVSAYAPLSVKEPELLRVLHVGRNEAEGFFYYAMELADAVAATGVTSESVISKSVGRGAGEPRNTGSLITDSLMTDYVPRTLKHEHETRGRLPLAECLKLGKELATALGRLHRAGLLHRDVKPSNVVYVRGEARLADIGLVTNFDRTVTLESGTKGYSPPEGVGAPDGDLYALGKLLYVLSTGQDRMLFPKLPDLGGLDRKAARDIRELNPLLLKACETDPKRRYPTAEKLLADLEYLEEGSSLRRLRIMKRTLKVAAVVMGVVLVAGAFWWERRQSGAERDRRMAAGMLRDVQLERAGEHKANWVSEHWGVLSNAAQIRVDKELVEQAAATLAGIDARAPFAQHGQGASSVAFAVDGTLLAGGLKGQPARLIRSDGVVTAFSTSSPGPIAFDSNNTPLQVALESRNRFVVRELATGTVRHEYIPEQSAYRSSKGELTLALSADGLLLAAFLRDDSGINWVVRDLASGTTLGQRPASNVTMLAFSPDNALLAIGQNDGQVVVHDVRSLEVVASIGKSTRRTAVASLAFGRDYLIPQTGATPGRSWLMAVGNEGAQVVVWDIARDEQRASLRGFQYQISALAFSPDGATLASGGRYSVRLWDVATEKVLLSLPGTAVDASGNTPGVDDADGLAFSADGSRLAVAARNCLSVWELEHHRGLRVLRGLATQVDNCWFSPDGRWVAGLSHDWQLGVWKVESGHLHAAFELPEGWSPDNAGCVFDADGQTMAFAAGNSARLFDLGKREMIRQWRVPWGLSDSLAYDRTGQLLLLRVDSQPGQRPPRTWVLRHLQANGQAPVIVQQTATNGVAYQTRLSPNGDAAAIVDIDWPEKKGQRTYSWLIYEISSGRPLGPRRGNPGHFGPIWDARGHRLLFDNTPQATTLLSPADEVVETLPAHVLAVSASKKWMALAPPQSAGWVLAKPDAPADGVTLGMDWRNSNPPTFSRDERFLAWGTEEGVVLVADVEAVMRQLEALKRGRVRE